MRELLIFFVCGFLVFITGFVLALAKGQYDNGKTNKEG